MSLKSIAIQDFDDFEVIISDNSDPDSYDQNRKYIQELSCEKIKHLKPSKILSMPDNWEFALNQATGNYVGTIIDKTLLRRDALKTVYSLLQNNTVDIVNFLNQGVEYFPDGKIFKFKKVGGYNSQQNQPFEFFDPKEELKRRFSFQSTLRNEGNRYCYGKICFGFFHKDLIQKIQKKAGKLFHPLACDYTSCALGLSFARSGAVINQSLLLSLSNIMGNGNSCAKTPGALLNFIKSEDPSLDIVKRFPVPNLYSSLHNICASDYQIAKNFSTDTPELGWENLIQRCAEDLNKLPFECPEEKLTQIDILQKFAASRNIHINKEIQESATIKRAKAFLHSRNKMGIIQRIVGSKIFLADHYTNLEHLLAP